MRGGVVPAGSELLLPGGARLLVHAGEFECVVRNRWGVATSAHAPHFFISVVRPCPCPRPRPPGRIQMSSTRLSCTSRALLESATAVTASARRACSRSVPVLERLRATPRRRRRARAVLS